MAFFQQVRLKEDRRDLNDDDIGGRWYQSTDRERRVAIVITPALNKGKPADSRCD